MLGAAVKSRTFVWADRVLFAAGVLALAGFVITTARANIAADSIDYYVNLQRLVSPHEAPIVENTHFAEQRSPGFSLVAAVPFALLTIGVEPWVETQVVEAGPLPGPPDLRPPAASEPPLSPRPHADGPAPPSPPRPPGAGTRPPPEPAPGEAGSEFHGIPVQPVLLRDVPFKDFEVPGQESRYRWKTALALALTSYGFLFLGLAAGALALRWRYPRLPAWSLLLLLAVASPVFLQEIFVRPLYATLTAFGASALFALFFLRGFETRRTWVILAAGFFLGLLVLTRLETAVLAAGLGVVLLVGREWQPLGKLALGSAWASVAWAACNQVLFGTPLHFAVLRGDINRLALDWGYIFNALFHPASGILIWSPLVILGLAGLLLSRAMALRALAVGSGALVLLYLVRVPVMVWNVGGGLMEIGGLPVTPPPTVEAMRELIRSDMNRYVSVLAPFAVLGVRDLLGRMWVAWRPG